MFNNRKKKEKNVDGLDGSVLIPSELNDAAILYLKRLLTLTFVPYGFCTNFIYLLFVPYTYIYS